MPQRKLTAQDFKPRRSKFMRDEDAKDEQQLAAILIITIIIGALTLLALHYTGTFDKIYGTEFIYNVI